MIYQTERNGITVSYDPEDTDLAKEAAEKVVGEVGSTVDRKQAAQIRSRYRDLHMDKYGEESRYA